MSRQSLEAKSLAAYRAGDVPLPPPRNLSKAAAILWREIVAARPVDQFDAGNSILLETYVVLTVHTRGLYRALGKGEPDAALLRRCMALTKTLATLASKLRLTPQAQIDRRSHMLDERSDPGAADDSLIGGHARKVN